jgi:cell wall-associated NlpC family hydrolase
LARGIGATQNLGGREVYVGRRDLAAGLADAAMGRPIALQNLQPGWPLNWSQNPSGAPMVDHGRIYCFTRNPSTGALVETSAGQVWERQTNSLTGTFVPCS